jgi:hypothetical protein
MFLSNRSLDRRTFLRGMGATVALPLLDAMIPARALLASTAVTAVPRLAFVYFPHGAIMDDWTPRTAGGDLELGRILEPLAPYRHRLTVVSGLENRHAYGPVHTITPGTWLSATSPRKRSAAAPPRTRDDAMDAATADQLAADHLGHDTPLPSMVVATEEPHPIGAGIWEGEYDARYSTTVSFRRAQVPVPVEFRPQAVFDTLFGRDTTADSACSSTSVLDLVAADAARLRTRLGRADRAVLGDYLETVRDVERRVEMFHLRSESFGGQVPLRSESLGGGAEAFTERMTLMFDMIALAFRADLTRVASIMMAAEASSTTYEHLGARESFHALSHHQNDPDRIEQLVRIQTFHTRMLARFVRTLADSPDLDGSLLDRSLILFGSNMSNSHAHDHFPLPLAVIGGGCGTRRGGRHLRYPDHTPMSNLLLTMVRRAGVPAESIGDSTSECAEL